LSLIPARRGPPEGRGKRASGVQDGAAGDDEAAGGDDAAGGDEAAGGDDAAGDDEAAEDSVVAPVFDRTVEEGTRRLVRTWPGLLATGLVGGMDVGIGVMALALVRSQSGSALLGSVAFGIGFVALTLSGSELFTENFLIPVAAIVAGHARWRSLARLWAGTLVMNLLGGWILMGLIVVGLPQLKPTLVTLGAHFVAIGLGRQALAAAVLGGGVITLMTWMQHGSDSTVAKLIAAWSAAFLLAAGSLNHAIVMSMEMFGALEAGAPFGYLAWLKAFGIACLGNLLGGVGLVTILRLIQVGRAKIEAEREAAAT
jgi:formate/nitrite transporter FocA (FNT family)